MSSEKISSQQLNALKEAASLAQQQAHVPYSGFQVGAALYSAEGKMYFGCNVENVSYPLCQCAEASAISAMVVDGGRRITNILIASPNDDFCPPCGGCRQKIREFATPDTQVHMATREGAIHTMSIGDLLPFAFETIHIPD